MAKWNLVSLFSNFIKNTFVGLLDGQEPESPRAKRQRKRANQKVKKNRRSGFRLSATQCAAFTRDKIAQCDLRLQENHRMMMAENAEACNIALRKARATVLENMNRKYSESDPPIRSASRSTTTSRMSKATVTEKPSRNLSRKSSSVDPRPSFDSPPRTKSSRNLSSRDLSSRNASTRDLSSRNASTRDLSSRNGSSRDLSSRNASTRDLSSRNHSSRNLSSRNLSSRNGSTRDLSSRNHSSRNLSRKTSSVDSRSHNNAPRKSKSTYLDTSNHKYSRNDYPTYPNYPTESAACRVLAGRDLNGGIPMVVEDPRGLDGDSASAYLAFCRPKCQNMEILYGVYDEQYSDENYYYY